MPLPHDFVEDHSPGNGGVERGNRPDHGDGEKGVAFLFHERPDPFPFRSDHDGEVCCEIQVVIKDSAAALGAGRPRCPPVLKPVDGVGHVDDPDNGEMGGGPRGGLDDRRGDPAARSFGRMTAWTPAPGCRPDEGAEILGVLDAVENEKEFFLGLRLDGSQDLAEVGIRKFLDDPHDMLMISPPVIRPSLPWMKT